MGAARSEDLSGIELQVEQSTRQVRNHFVVEVSPKSRLEASKLWRETLDLLYCQLDDVFVDGERCQTRKCSEQLERIVLVLKQHFVCQ